MSQQQTSSSSWKPSGGHEAPSLAAADAATAAAAEGDAVVPPARAALSPVLARIRRIHVTNAWHELTRSENNNTTLTADIAQALLSISDKQSTALVSALENARIKTIGSLLTAAEDIR